MHYQGIIHRDIKPANLLYTSDRRRVKITDFGVSHFSYAQRLAAASDSEKAGLLEDTPDDPILLDESDLSKTAGTPTFLAPEVICEFGDSMYSSATSSSVNVNGNGNGNATSAGSSSSGQTARRPPITKAIDVWALGVTLYSLLFGHTPFLPEGNNEYALYRIICTKDWDVAETMGVDRVPTGGRHPRKGDKSEGAMVIRLLDQLLQKDAAHRITLDGVKVSWPEPCRVGFLLLTNVQIF